MFYRYDETGRYCGTSAVAVANTTTIPPEQLTGEWYWNGSVWNHDIQLVPKVYGVVDFKLRFTIQERLAIKRARESDPIIDDFYELLDDLRLQTVNCNLLTVREAVNYIESAGLVGIGRAAEILS